MDAARLRALSVCSGIEAASVAWDGLIDVHAFAEVDRFPSAALAHHYPEVPNLGDLTRWRDWPADLLASSDVLVGGTPCQAFSVAGLRRSLEDDRGNLSLQFVELAHAIDDLRRASGRPPLWILWENVPGVLSVADNAFGCFLGGLVGSDAPVEPPRGRGWTDAGVVSGPARSAAWRILDAQFFGLAQRRRRVFVIARGGPGAWDCADALLPVIESRGWHPEPSRTERSDITRAIRAGAGGGCGPGPDEAAGGQLIPFDTSQLTHPENRSNPQPGDPCHALKAGAHPPAVACMAHGQANAEITEDGSAPTLSWIHEAPIAFNWQNAGGYGNADDGLCVTEDGTGPLQASQHPAVAQDLAVRRLTPRECERLQGFPDDYTRIPYRGKPAERCPDGPRYRALGNSMAVPVMRYLGTRILACDERHAPGL